jgi:type IV secretory pathway VirB6-like protein
VNVQWHFLQGLYDTLVTPLLAQLQGMIGGVCATMQPIVLAMITLWLGVVGMDIANGTKTVQAAVKDFFIAGMVVGALQVGQYQDYISNFFLQAVPNTISTALGGGASPVAGLDLVLDNAVTAGAKAYEALPSYSLKTIPLALGILVFLGVALASVGWAFAVYMISAIINVVAIVVGPIFLALGAIPQTRRFAAGWLSLLVGGCTTQILCTAVMLLLNGAENTMLLQTVVSAAGSGSNSIAMLWSLAQCGLLLALGAAVTKKIPSIAQAIGGGVYHGSAGAHSATLGMAAAAGSAAMAGARGAVGAAGKAGSTIVQDARSAVRPAAPTGPSLSGKS